MEPPDWCLQSDARRTWGLRKLGRDVRDARRRRRILMALLAGRARISSTTLAKVETGEWAVALGICAAVLHALACGAPGCACQRSGRHDRPSIDERRLPERVRLPRSKRPLSQPAQDSDD
jgi:hypothetical protein